MIKTILVPSDGSEHAEKALDLGADLALKYDARLLLLHVMKESGSDRVPEDLRAYERLEHIRISERGMLESIAEQILRDGELRAREKGATNIQTISRSGDPTAVILEVAKKENADLLVMGSRGLGNLTGLLLGSVSHKVAHLSQCSCITVK